MWVASTNVNNKNHLVSRTTAFVTNETNFVLEVSLRSDRIISEKVILRISFIFEKKQRYTTLFKSKHKSCIWFTTATILNLIGGFSNSLKGRNNIYLLKRSNLSTLQWAFLDDNYEPFSIILPNIFIILFDTFGWRYFRHLSLRQKVYCNEWPVSI